MAQAGGSSTTTAGSTVIFYRRKRIRRGNPMEDECQNRENAATSAIAHLSSKEHSEFSTSHPSNETEFCEASTVDTSPMDTKRRLIKNYGPNSYVSSVRVLLSTGLLQGIPVKYSFHKLKAEVPALIKDRGYLCGCSLCNFNEVFSAVNFGKHLGIAKANHTDHILLNNGKSLFQVVKQLKRSRLSSLESVIESKIGCSPNWECYNTWKESFRHGSHESDERCQLTDSDKHLNSEDHVVRQIVTRSKISGHHNLVGALALSDPKSGPDGIHLSKKRRSKRFGRLTSKENHLPDGAELINCDKRQAESFAFALSYPKFKSDDGMNECQDRENDAASAVVHLSSKEISEFSTDNPRSESELCEASAIHLSPTEFKQRSCFRPVLCGPNGYVSSVRVLLSTGLLEGIPIRYSFHKLKAEVPAVIKDLGYQCGCSSCNFKCVFNATDFGKHLGIANANHNDHILFSSGRSLLQVVKELKLTRISLLKGIIERKIGCTPNWECYNSWKESFQHGSHLLADSDKHLNSEDHVVRQIVTRSKVSGHHNLMDALALSYPKSRPDGTQLSKKRRSKRFGRLISRENYLHDGAELINCDKGQAESFAFAHSCQNSGSYVGMSECQDRENDAASGIIHLPSIEFPKFSMDNAINEEKLDKVSTIHMSLIGKKQRFMDRDPNSCVSSMRILLSTGLLEGIPVKYSFHKLKTKVPAVIKDLGYQCGCSSCNFNCVFNAVDFGKHLGIASMNPYDHIILNNGKSLFQVMTELKHTCISSLEGVIESKIGCTPNWECYNAWKESFQHGSHESEQRYLLSDSDKQLISEDHISLQIVTRSKTPEHQNTLDDLTLSYPNSIPDGTRLSKKRRSKRFGHLISMRNNLPDGDELTNGIKEWVEFFSCARSYPNSGTDGTQLSEKRRRKSLGRLIFMGDYLPNGAELTYRVKGQAAMKGYKEGAFIKCCCCNMKITPSQFEVHAGWGSKHQPYRHIFTSSGVSLYDLCVSLIKRRYFIPISNECYVCGDGGQMVFCARCPKTFHSVCLGLDCRPCGGWHCSYCDDTTSVKVIKKIVSPTIEIGCCCICRSSHFCCKDVFNDETVLICDQCEKEFHVGCLRKIGSCDIKAPPRGKWFCERDCMIIYYALQNIITRGAKIVPETFKGQLINKPLQMGLIIDGCDATWQLLSGKIRSAENMILLSKAFHIFGSSFDPIIERSGRDLIPAMVHGRDMGGYELGGVYCAVLNIKSQVVSAATLRVLGREVAELTLAATRRESQRMGFFGCLLSCIELSLRDLKVELLILAASEHSESMWVQKFGFKEMEEERSTRLASIYPLLMFKGTKMLEKPLSQHT